MTGASKTRSQHPASVVKSGVAEGRAAAYRGPAADVPASAVRADLPVWKLEDAKARFSEVVRRARVAGPQLVTVRGRDAVVIVDAEEYAAMQNDRREQPDLIDFLRDLALADLDIEREPDRGRDIEL